MTESEKQTWLKERKTYIGGSDIGCILGLSKYKSALDIYLEKTTDIIEEATSEAAYWGNILEDIVAKEYSNRTGNSIKKSKGLIRHPKYKFLAANIDRWVIKDDGKKHVLECKTASFTKNKLWGEEGTDQIPEQYLCQVAYYAAICDVERVDIAVLIGGQGFRMYTYQKNEEFEGKLISAAIAFWNNYVAKGIAPEASNSSDIAKLYPKSNGLEIEATTELTHQVEELKALKMQEKSIVSAKVEIETKIKSSIGFCESLVGQDGLLLATWKSGKPRKVLDVKKLQAEHKGIYQQYLTEKEGGRTLLVK